jgi:hypothetical protein
MKAILEAVTPDLSGPGMRVPVTLSARLAGRPARLVVGAGHWVGQPRRPYPSFARTRITLVRLRALGVEHMQPGEEPKVGDAIEEITELLAAAYQRRARIRLVHTTPKPLQSTEGLNNTGETSPHELK